MARPRGKAVEKKRQKVAERRAKQQRAQRWRQILRWAVVVAVLGGAAAFYVITREPAPGIAFESLGNQHLGSIAEPHRSYNSRPPSSGPHFGGLANWGEAPEALPAEVFVHNLEDGGVVLAYNCPDGCDELVDGLRDTLSRFDTRRLVLTPYPDIVDPDGTPHRAAAVAWTRVYYFDEFDDETQRQVDRFIRLFEGIDHHVRRTQSPLGP